MRLYLDTNIYSRLVTLGEVDRAHDLFSSKGIDIIFTFDALQEMDDILDIGQRDANYLAAGKLGNVLGPVSTRVMAQELINQVARTRPNWLNSSPTVDRGALMVMDNQKAWNLLRAGKIAGAVSRRDGDPHRKKFKQAATIHQKSFKNLKGAHLFWADDDGVVKIVYPLSIIDNTWREDCLVTWTSALFSFAPSSRDLIKCSEHAIDENEMFEDKGDFFRFWMEEADAENFPLNVTRGLVWHFQLKMKSKSSNARDVFHAVNMHFCDYFITADKDLHAILKELIVHQAVPGKPVLLDRNRSIVEQIEAIL